MPIAADVFGNIAAQYEKQNADLADILRMFEPHDAPTVVKIISQKEIEAGSTDLALRQLEKAAAECSATAKRLRQLFQRASFQLRGQ